VNIRTATMVAIIGVSVSLVTGAVMYLIPSGYFLSPRMLASAFAFLSLHISLLVFLVSLYRRQ
jgi:hypothetical protein